MVLDKTNYSPLICLVGMWMIFFSKERKTGCVAVAGEALLTSVLLVLAYSACSVFALYSVQKDIQFSYEVELLRQKRTSRKCFLYSFTAVRVLNVLSLV